MQFEPYELPQEIQDLIKKLHEEDYSIRGITAYIKEHYPKQRISKHKVGNFIGENKFLKKNCKENGIDIDNVTSYRVKWKHISINVKQTKYTWNEIKEDVLDTVRSHAPKYRKLIRTPIEDRNLLIVDPADIHIWKLSIEEETGKNYNCEIACNRVLEWVSWVITKSKGFPLEEIILIIGNDVVHVDNPFKTTTWWTPQDTDKLWHQMQKIAKLLYIDILEMLIPIAKVRVIFNPSNHDFVLWYMIAEILEAYFHNNKEVTFDTGINDRKYYKYWANLIVTTHWKGMKWTDIADVIPRETRENWLRCDTKYTHVYKHHLHHKELFVLTGKDYWDITVETIRSPSESDRWHHAKGYGWKSAIEWAIHSYTWWQVARLTHWF